MTNKSDYVLDRDGIAEAIWSHTGSEEDGCCSSSHAPCEACLEATYLPAADAVIDRIREDNRGR